MTSVLNKPGFLFLQFVELRHNPQWKKQVKPEDKTNNDLGENPAMIDCWQLNESRLYKRTKLSRWELTIFFHCGYEIPTADGVKE